MTGRRSSGLSILNRFSAIVRLFYFRCPSAIARFIVAIIIYSIKGIGCVGARSHIKIKMSKRSIPTLTYADTSPSIRRIFRIIRIMTPLLHGTPRIVLWRLAKPMSDVILALFAQAPTTTSMSTCNTVDSCDKRIPTATLKRKKSFLAIAVRKCNNKNTSDGFAAPIPWFRSFSHISTSFGNIISFIPMMSTFTRGKYS